MEDDPLIGREPLVQAMLNHISEGKNLLLIGPEGTGKTAILKRLIDVGSGRNNIPGFIYCGKTDTLKTILQQMASSLHLDFHDLDLTDSPGSNVQGLTTSEFNHCLKTITRLPLKKSVVQSLKSRRYALILDHLRAVKHPSAAFLEFLIMEYQVPIIGVIRELHYKRIGRLNRLVWAFTKLRVENLERKAAAVLIDRCLERSRLELPDRSRFTAALLRLSKGNPKIMVQVCAAAGDGRYQFNHRTDIGLILLDLKMQSLGEKLDGEQRERLGRKRQALPGI